MVDNDFFFFKQNTSYDYASKLYLSVVLEVQKVAPCALSKHVTI